MSVPARLQARARLTSAPVVHTPVATRDTGEGWVMTDCVVTVRVKLGLTQRTNS